MAAAKSFRELNVFLAARSGVAEIFEMTKGFPQVERFSLIDQIRRSSRAVMAILAEAWARRRYKAAFVNKIDEALGESYETQSWLISALDAKYIDEPKFTALDSRYNSIGAMLSRMIDRADDFCKHAPAADYRAIPKGRTGPITGH